MFSKVLPEDLLNYGLIPEFIGRLPVISAVHQLSRDDLVKILTEPKNALVRQYQHMFHLERAKLRFTDAALRAIAEKALKRDTGARALRAVLEEIMIGLMYDLPEGDNAGTEFVIDEGDVLKPKRVHIGHDEWRAGAFCDRCRGKERTWRAKEPAASLDRNTASSATRCTARARRSARPGGTSSPSTSSVITSGTPPTIVATTGRPALIASMSATGSPS